MTLISNRSKNTARPPRLLQQLLWGGVVLCSLSACASLPNHTSDASASIQQKPVELKDVPFFAQTDSLCASAALAMVLNHQGQKTSSDALEPLVLQPERQGNRLTEVQAVPQQFGLLSYQVAPNTLSLFDALNAGYPVLVLLNLALQTAPEWHYAVVVGYNPNNNSVVLRSGKNEREEVSMLAFEKMWESSKNWGFVTLKPDAPIPAFAAPQAYLNALLGLEQVSSKHALQGYQHAIETWPKEAWFRFGGGNMYLAEKQLPEAEQELTQAVALYPDFADAWNNLAQVQLQQGKKPEARASINKAIALGGANAQAYQDMAERIN
jgi:tetratricopeptide (TPR) repeat protein